MSYLLQENGYKILQETGYGILLDFPVTTSCEVTNSDYKWISPTLKIAQGGPVYTPYFKLKIKNNSLLPNAVLTSPNVPVLGDATTAPDGNILMAGGDGAGNLGFWKCQTNNTQTILVDSYGQINQNTTERIPNDDLYFSQSFNNSNLDTLSYIELYLKKNGSSATGLATAYIYSTNGGKPTGSPLATSGTFDISTLSTSTFSLATFNFTGSNSILLSANTTYALVITGYLSNFGIYIGLNATAGYGTFSYSSDGISWASIHSATACFYVYATISVAPYLSISPSITIISSGTGYISTLNTSIAVSNWIQGTYVIDIYFWRTVAGSTTIGMARSMNGGSTWSINPYSYTIGSGGFYASQNYSISAGQPIYNPTLNVVESTCFYIRVNSSYSTTLGNIYYLNWSGGASYNTETMWSRTVNSLDWTLHSLDVLYFDGSWYVFLSGYQNWFETVSGNGNYGLYMARLDNLTNNSLTDSWQLINQIIVANSNQNTNTNSFTFPKITTDGNMFYLTCNAKIIEGQQTSGTGTAQNTVVPNNYYYMFQSADMENFTYPLPLFSLAGVPYGDTAGVSFVNQGSYYYLLGNGQNWQYILNNIIADITNAVLNYNIQEVAGSASQITIEIGNANNQWIGTGATGVGAAAIAVNSQILLEQGYVTSIGNEVVPRNIFYIDTITLNSSSSDNTATIAGRDINRNLQNVSTKFSYVKNGVSYYSDLFDGTTITNWNMISGSWVENWTSGSGGFLMETTGANSPSIISLNSVNNNQESSIVFVIMPLYEYTIPTYVYPLYLDAHDYLSISVAGNSGYPNNVMTIQLVINGSSLYWTTAGGGSWTATPTSLTIGNYSYGKVPIFIRKYQFHIYDILIGTPNNSGSALYNADTLDPNGEYSPFYTITGIDLSLAYTSAFLSGSNEPLVSGSVALGVTQTVQGFQAFKYLQFGESLSLQDSMEYLCSIAGITNFDERYTFFDNQYLPQNYNGPYSIQNGFMVINPNKLVFNINNPIKNGEINLQASVQQTGGSVFGFNIAFRSSLYSTNAICYIFSMQNIGGVVNASFYIYNNGVQTLLATTYITINSNYFPIDLTEQHTYKISLIDQYFMIFIDGRCYLMWQDSNFTLNSIQFSNGYWGVGAFSNSIVTIGELYSTQLYNQITNVTFNPGDDMVSILQNVLETVFAYSFTDQFGRYIGLALNSTDPSDYTYDNLLYTVQSQGSSSSIINEVIVTGNNVIATYKDQALIAATGQVRSLNVTDYTILTYQDAITRAINTLISNNSLAAQQTPTNPMNVGSEMFDVINIINTGDNSTSLNGTFRIFNQTFALAGSNGQYSIQIETGNL
jgi:hypothetical protein